MLHTLDDYNQIYIEEFTQEYIDIKNNSLLDLDIKKYRVKTIKSGDILEYECYPLFKNTKCKRVKRLNESSKAQQNLNDKNKIKKVIRIINTNFKDGDTWATFTYDEEHLPKSHKEAKRDMTNYIRRLKRQLKKLGYPELKYIYVTEFEENKTRLHHHIILNVQDRDLVESVWNCGARTHARRMQADENGFEGMARYITKDPRGKKSYTPSRNLKKPTVSISDYKMTRAKANRIAMYQDTAQVEFEKMNKKYKFLECKVYISDFISGAYLHAKLRKKKGAKFDKKRPRKLSAAKKSNRQSRKRTC